MGLPSFVRVPDAEYHLISRMMYMGADGVMLPRTESLEQVKTAVEAIRFAPLGKTGCGGHGQYRRGESFDEYQKSRYLFVQIESQPGIDLLPEIIEKYGNEIAGIIIGPYDMSVMLGTPCNIKSDVMIEAIQKVFDICNERKMSCGIFCDDEVLSKKYRDMGANVLWACTDNNFFMRGFNQVFDALAEME
jgi:2-keto-3-deoxy-L-rhamnonate aldolase RhmA